MSQIVVRLITATTPPNGSTCPVPPFLPRLRTAVRGKHPDRVEDPAHDGHSRARGQTRLMTGLRNERSHAETRRRGGCSRLISAMRGNAQGWCTYRRARRARKMTPGVSGNPLRVCGLPATSAPPRLRVRIFGPASPMPSVAPALFPGQPCRTSAGEEPETRQRSRLKYQNRLHIAPAATSNPKASPIQMPSPLMCRPKASQAQTGAPASQ